jgi:hypothetical protein
MKSIARLAAACLALCAAPLACAQALIQGYTCCNLHYDKDWISDANWLHAPMIPAGARIKVLSYDASNHATVEIDGKPMRIGQDYGRKEESLEKFISKLVVKTNPRSKIDRYPENVRSAIKNGKVIPGMTREQVIISVGYPPTHRTPTLDSPVWHHWQSRAGRFEVRWDDKGRVREIIGQK